MTGKCSLAWGFHIEPLVLWWLSLPSSERYDFVWVLEDDVGVAGSLVDLIQEYSSNPADLLSHTVGPMNPEWCWRDVHTAEFAKLAQPNTRKRKRGESGFFNSPEHVQRFSAKLLNRLADLCVNKGVTAWSEMFAPTVATCSRDLTVDTFSDKHIGEPYVWDGRVDAAAWPELSAGPAPRLFHALKF